MGKIKYQGGLTKLIATKIGEKNRNLFQNLVFTGDFLNQIRLQLATPGTINWNIVSFSSARDFAEQILSILSFLKYVGTPASWTVYSDGTHTDEHQNLVKAGLPFVTLVKTDVNQLQKEALKTALQPGFDPLMDYATRFPLGKKLFFYLNHTIDRTTLFVDSDIVFYQEAKSVLQRLDLSKSGYFLPDAEWNSLDSRYKVETAPQLYQLNAGCMLLNKEYDQFGKGIRFLGNLKGSYEYFSEQTTFHILSMENGFYPLDPRTFVLNSSDQFDFAYGYHPKYIALRHYTGPVRHKMWQKDWKWHLSVS